MNSDRAAPFALERRKVTERLRLTQHAKSIWLAGNRQISFRIACYLDEDTAVGTAFVKLSGRMQEAWAIARCGRHMKPAAQSRANGLQQSIMRLSFLNVGEQRDVVAGFGSRKVIPNHCVWRRHL